MNKFTEFQEEIKAITGREGEAQEELKDAANVISGIEQEFEQAIIEGDVVREEELEKAYKNAISKQQVLEKKYKTLTKIDVQSMLNKSDKLRKLASEVIEEHTKVFKNKQIEFDSELEKLEELKASYLKQVHLLGEVYREGQKIGSELGTVKKHVTGQITVHSIQFAWSDVTKSGAIYISIAESERLFKNVDNQYKVRP